MADDPGEGVKGSVCDGGDALAGSGFGAKEYMSLGGSESRTPIGVTYDTFGLCHVISREYTSFPVSSSKIFVAEVK